MGGSVEIRTIWQQLNDLTREKTNSQRLLSKSQSAYALNGFLIDESDSVVSLKSKMIFLSIFLVNIIDTPLRADVRASSRLHWEERSQDIYEPSVIFEANQILCPYRHIGERVVAFLRENFEFLLSTLQTEMPTSFTNDVLRVARAVSH